MSQCSTRHGQNFGLGARRERDQHRYEMHSIKHVATLTQTTSEPSSASSSSWKPAASSATWLEGALFASRAARQSCAKSSLRQHTCNGTSQLTELLNQAETCCAWGGGKQLMHLQKQAACPTRRTENQRGAPATRPCAGRPCWQKGTRGNEYERRARKDS